MVTPRIFEVSVEHLRLSQRKHAFTYNGWGLGLEFRNKAEDSCDSLWPLLRRGVYGIFSINFSDYLPVGGYDLMGRLKTLLTAHGVPFVAEELSAEMLTMPRFMGYVFNPVTFYLCRSESKIVAFIAEVRNTFGEMFHYVMPTSCQDLPQTFEFPKKMFVSPFYSVSGQYRLTVREFGKNVDVTVELLRPGELPFAARIKGKARAASRYALLLMLVKYPLFLPLIMVRIHYQAFKIYVKRAGRLEPQGINGSSGAIRVENSIWYTWRAWLVRILG
jgi:DUF1365 family protein